MWLQLLEAALPAILQFVEQVFVRPVGAPSNSTTKLGAAVNLAQSMLTVAASAGAIPVAAANDVGAIASKVQATVVDMKNKGMLGGNTLPSTSGPQTSIPSIIMPQVATVEKASAPAPSAPVVNLSQVLVKKGEQLSGPAEQVKENTAADIVAAMRIAREHKS